MEIVGIYIIYNLKNNKCYIGQSLRVKERIRAHRYALRHNKHYNNYLQAAWNKYGEKSFHFSICCSVLGKNKKDILKNLNAFEKTFIKLYLSFENGYNLTSGGDNHEVSTETKRKLSESHKGIKPSEYCRKMTSKRMKGRVVSKETKEKLRKAITGKYHSEETKNKIRLLNKEKGVVLAKEYNVHRVQISSIKNGKTWRHVKI